MSNIIINPYALGEPALPLTITGLALWLDASDESTITHSSGSVSQWDDKSGNARHVTQGTAANQPTTGTRTLNGNNAIDFTSKTGLSGPFPANTEMTIFLAFHSDSDTGYTLFKPGPNGGGTYAGLVSDGDTNTTVTSSVGSPTIRSNGVLFTGSTRDDLHTFVEPGPNVVTITGLTTSETQHRLMAYRIDTDSFQLDGLIGEVFAAPTANVTTAIRDDAEAYLASKWGVTL